jgi:hypothetical protein
MGDRIERNRLLMVGLEHPSHIRLEVRDSVTGELKGLREAHNVKHARSFASA